MTGTPEERLRQAQLQLQEQERMIAALTRRVWALETGQSVPAQPEIPETPRLDQQPVAEVVPPPPAPISDASPILPKDWEERLGTNWLNRAGVVLLVIGVALFLGFALTSMGPIGKVAIGTGVGLAVLAAGNWFARKDDFRNFGMGVTAGGYAILYATAFAAHSVDAARVIHNAYLGMALQVAVAGAALWQAVRFGSERSSIVAYLAAFLGIMTVGTPQVLFAGAVPLTLSGLWLASKLEWRILPWTILAYSWMAELRGGKADWDIRYLGHPLAWLHLCLFAAYEIRWRLRDCTNWNVAWIAANSFLFLNVTFGSGRFNDGDHAASVFALAALAALSTSAARWKLGVRHEALSEGLLLLCIAAAWTAKVIERDPLLGLMGLSALAAAGLWWNRRDARLPMTLAGEGLLGITTLALLLVFPESRLVNDGWAKVRLALPQLAAQGLLLLAAAQWLTRTAWAGFASVICLVEITVLTLPRFAATGALALEAALILTAGIARSHRKTLYAGAGVMLVAAFKIFALDWYFLTPIERTLSTTLVGVLLLAAGWRLGRKELQAAGLFALYLTAYAARAVEAMQCIPEPRLAIALQIAVALAGLWIAVRAGSDEAASVALGCAFLAITGSEDMRFRFMLSAPLTVLGIWLAGRMRWRLLPWAAMLMAWFTQFAGGRLDWELQYFGKPLAWAHLAAFSWYEIRWRMRGMENEAIAWLMTNAAWFCLVSFTASDYQTAAHVASVALLGGVLALASSAARLWLGVRHEALSEVMALTAFALSAALWFQNRDELALLMIWLAMSMAALAWNRREPTVALTVSGEFLLGLAAIAMLFVFPESRVLSSPWIDVREALPQMLLTTACLFAAGRWLTMTPWSSGAALLCLAVMTLWTFPKTAGTIVLALEAVLALAIGFYLARRPIRIGGLCLFVFSVLKVFFHDLSELDTLPRIFSFIVLGILLIGASWAYTKYRQQLQKYL
jgi:hypothetical protein